MSQELYILGQNNISNYVHVHGTLTHRAEVMSMIKAMMMMQSGGLVGNQARGNVMITIGRHGRSVEYINSDKLIEQSVHDVIPACYVDGENVIPTSSLDFNHRHLVSNNS